MNRLIWQLFLSHTRKLHPIRPKSKRQGEGKWVNLIWKSVIKNDNMELLRVKVLKYNSRFYYIFAITQTGRDDIKGRLKYVMKECGYEGFKDYVEKRRNICSYLNAYMR